MDWSIILLLLVATCLSPTQMRAQPLECNFQEVDLLPCLSKTDGNTTEACCLALDRALTAGHHCLCSLLPYATLQSASANMLLAASPLALTFPGCALLSPSLASCGAPLEPNSPPAPNKDPDLTPAAAAPAPRLMDSSANSTPTRNVEPPMARGMPRTNRNFGLLSDSYSGSTDARLQMHKSLFWLISIPSWIVCIIFP